MKSRSTTIIGAGVAVAVLGAALVFLYAHNLQGAASAATGNNVGAYVVTTAIPNGTNGTSVSTYVKGLAIPAAARPAEGKEVPFEEALKKLEGIVEAMESDELPLETLLARFEEGTRLAKICQAKLAEAELRIQQLEKDAAGEPALKPANLADDSAAE